MSRAAHVSVLLGEVVDHGDQVEADQAHAQHPLPLLHEKGENKVNGKEGKVENKEEDNTAARSRQTNSLHLLKRDGEVEEEKRRKEENENTVESCTAKE